MKKPSYASVDHVTAITTQRKPMKLSDAIEEYFKILSGELISDDEYKNHIKTIIDNHSAQVWGVVDNESGNMARAVPMTISVFPQVPFESTRAVGRWMQEQDRNWPFPPKTTP